MSLPWHEQGDFWVGHGSRLEERAEVLDTMVEAGFTNFQMYGHLVSRTPYDQTARRLVVVATK